MGAITIRRLDDAVIERLKADAKANGRSMEEEARATLTRAFRPRLTGQAAVDQARAFRKEMFGDRVFPDSAPLIRELREGDFATWDDE
jgi:plasmid stability protein